VVDALRIGTRATILPVEPDELHIATAKVINENFKGAVSALGLKLPFL
jgi:hypothetical protein